MRKVLVCFSDDRMTQSKEVCVNSAMRNGFDVCWPQNPNTISQEFKEFNKEIFKHERGFGYWLWKSYHVYKAILQLQEGDILVYSDAGVEWINNVDHLINAMDEDIFFFSNGHQHIHWCKAIVRHLICLGSGNEQQVQASVILFKVNQKTIDFVKEWLMYCQLPGFIDDSKSLIPNHPEFAEHRHDQAILTCLQIKYNFKLHWWADSLWYESQRYRWPEDKYPSMFIHHRKRDKGKGENKNPEW